MRRALLAVLLILAACDGETMIADAGAVDAGVEDAGDLLSDAGSDSGDARVELRVVVRGQGAGRLTGPGIDCSLASGSDCIELVDVGTELTLTATPDEGSVIAAWEGASCEGGTCVVRVDGPRSIGVVFDAIVPTLTVEVVGEGTVTSDPDGVRCGDDCAQAYEDGIDVTLRATPAEGQRWGGWGGACAGRQTTCVVSMTASRHVTATFALERAVVRVEVDGSARVVSDPPRIDCPGACEASVLIGESLTLTVQPSYRWTIDRWEGASCAGASCTITPSADTSIAVHLREHAPVILSESDRDPRVRLREDGLAVDFFEVGGVRSTRAVAPRSGVFYYEAHRLVRIANLFEFGVATAAAPLSAPYAGSDANSFGVSADGSIYYAGTWVGRVYAPNDRFGFVVDYRGDSPIVHVIARGVDGTVSVVHTQHMSSLTTPLYVFLSGTKRFPDWHVEINTGNDTTNVPFGYDPRAALRAAGLAEVAGALVLGFGDSYAGPVDAPPALIVPADRTVAAGTSVTLDATAIDAEEGDLSASIAWELLSSPHYAGRVRATGPRLTFTPTAIGVHPARATVRDRTGRSVEAIVRVHVAGPVAPSDPVRLVPDARTGSGIELSLDGLAARWTGGGKMGVRASQSIYGAFWYFEIQRLVAPSNMGGGLVTGDGDLNPYSWADVPASCSINMQAGVWHDLAWQRDFPLPAATYEHFGFAVDYRGEHPIVYVIAGNAVIAQLVLEDAWTELYPMIYGNPTGLTTTGSYDEAINFGATPFAYDPAAALAAYGVDTTDFVPRWGSATTSP